MKKHIEFVHPSDAKGVAAPWSTTESSYQDLTLKSEYNDRRYTLPLGVTKCRILPALATSSYGWMLPIHSLSYAGGRHVHPRTLKLGGSSESVFDLAYAWHKKHQPSDLYSKSNKSGVRLLTSPLCLCWILTEVDGKPVARLLQLSLYDGSRGGTPGLGFRILQLTSQKNETGEQEGDPIDPTKGVSIFINKQTSADAKYPSYSLSLGKEPQKIDDLIQQMDPTERDAIVPLEKVIQIPSTTTEWELLKKAVDPATVAKIRDAVS